MTLVGGESSKRMAVLGMDGDSPVWSPVLSNLQSYRMRLHKTPAGLVSVLLCTHQGTCQCQVPPVRALQMVKEGDFLKFYAVARNGGCASRNPRVCILA